MIKKSVIFSFVILSIGFVFARINRYEAAESGKSTSRYSVMDIQDSTGAEGCVISASNNEMWSLYLWEVDSSTSPKPRLMWKGRVNDSPALVVIKYSGSDTGFFVKTIHGGEFAGCSAKIQQFFRSGMGGTGQLVNESIIHVFGAVSEEVDDSTRHQMIASLDNWRTAMLVDYINWSTKIGVKYYVFELRQK